MVSSDSISGGACRSRSLRLRTELAELNDQSPIGSLANIVSSRIGIDSNGSLYWRATALGSISQPHDEVDADNARQVLTALRQAVDARNAVSFSRGEAKSAL